MNEKRFLLDKVEKGNAILSLKITDSVSDNNYFIMTKDFYEDEIDEIVDCLNEQQATIDKQNKLIKLIANACTYSKEHSVKEILRKEIRGIDTVTEESANAWHDYIILSSFFKEYYEEDWDNEQ